MAKTYEKIATYTIPSAQASYTFTSIPATYTDIVLVASGKVDVSSTTKCNVGNGSIDTGANYSWMVLSGDGSTPTSYKERNTSHTQNERYANWDATNVSTTIIQFQNYANTSIYKTWLSRGNNAATGVDAIVGMWRSYSAINQIQISATNATRNLAADTTITLYGIKAA
jgi:hypothetical protein